MPVSDQQKFKLLILQARFLGEKFSMHKDIEQEAMEEFSKHFKKRLKTMPDEIQKFFKKEEKASNVEPTPEENQNDYQDEPVEQDQADEEHEQEKHSDDSHKDTPSAKKPVIPRHLRGVYKSIAKITHPDKLKDMSEVDRMQKELLFKKAQRAVSSGDYIALMDVALHLNVQFPDPTEEDTRYVRKSIEKIRTKIKNIEKSAAWQWYHASEKQKPTVMKDYIYYVYQSEMR